MYFLDTNICIYYLNGKHKTVSDHFRLVPPASVKIPIIVKAELWYGIEKSQMKSGNRLVYEKFLTEFALVNLNSETLRHYARVRVALEKSGKIIGSNDLWIAAIVLANNGVLVTHNTREFTRVPELIIEDWTE